MVISLDVHSMAGTVVDPHEPAVPLHHMHTTAGHYLIETRHT